MGRVNVNVADGMTVRHLKHYLEQAPEDGIVFLEVPAGESERDKRARVDHAKVEAFKRVLDQIGLRRIPRSTDDANHELDTLRNWVEGCIEGIENPSEGEDVTMAESGTTRVLARRLYISNDSEFLRTARDEIVLGE